MRSKKKIFIFVFLCFVMCLGMGAYYLNPELKIKESKVVIEYGQDISLDVLDYLNLNDVKKEDYAKLKKEITLESQIDYIEEKNYPRVGTYELNFTYRLAKAKVVVEVKDTTAPTLLQPERIEILQNNKIDPNQMLECFMSQDLSENHIEIDVSSYNPQKVGQQNIQVSAIDEYQNKTVISFPIYTIKKLDSKYYSQTSHVTKNKDGLVKTILIKNKEKAFTQNVKVYCQHDVGARLGCDPAALYQSMKYKGYLKNVSLKTFIDGMPLSSNNDPRYGFAGNPYGQPVAAILETIYPKPLATYGKKYGNVSDFTGHSLQDCIEEMRKGNSVMVYATQQLKSPDWRNWSFGRMYNNLHCLTLSGYDPVKKQIRVTDPGRVASSYWVSYRAFEKSYNYKKFAIVVR